MKKKTALTAERARALLKYNPRTGALTWKVDKGRARAGDPAGHLDSSGYVKLRIDQAPYWAHRVIWLIVTGEWPKEVIDHRNCVRSDNRWRNLRDVSRSTNQQNQRRAHRNSKTGVLGVHRCREGFAASITVRGVVKQIGVHSTPEAAQRAYKTAKRHLHAGCTI